LFNIKKTPAYSKFSVDSFYNFISLGVLGLCGIITNVIIARIYGASALGVFNQAYAIYIVSTQIASLGIELSVLKYVAQYASEKKSFDQVITSGLIIVVASTSLFTIALFFLKNPISKILHSPDTASAILFLIPGLWCLSLNRIFFSILNAVRAMKAYAVLTALRYIVMLMSLLVLAYLNVPSKTLSAVFSFAELAIILPCFFLCRKKFKFNFNELYELVRVHLIFGIKSIFGGVIAVLNTRVDILMLGYFMSDSLVGKYSLASMVVEGVLQLPFVLRRNLDPIITRLHTLRQYDQLETFIRKIRGITFVGLLIVGLLLAILFPLAVDAFIGGHAFRESYRLFVILMIGAVAMGTYLPVSGILVQSGFPGYQTLFFLLCFATNAALNLILVVIWGAVGAAAATTISFCLSVLYLKRYALKYTNIRI